MEPTKNIELRTLLNSPILYKDELEHFQRLALSQYDESIREEMYIISFHYYYDAGQITKAFDYLLLGLSLLEKNPESPLKISLLTCAVKAATFFISIPNSMATIKATIAHDDPFKQPEIHSMCFYLLSNEALKKGHFNEAISYAKMAHYYALKIENNRFFYECNAQLQLVCALLETAKLEEANNYIDTFEWYIQNCKNDQEKVLIIAIQATISFLQGQQESPLLTMKTLLMRMLGSQEVMYSSYLAMHFKRILLKSNEKNAPLLEIILLCDNVIGRFTYMASKVDKQLPPHFTIWSQQFYTGADELISKLTKRNEQAYIIKFKTDVEPFDSVMKIHHLFTLKEIPFLLHLYSPEPFAIVTTEKGKNIIESTDNMTVIDGIATSAHEQNDFFELYNALNLAILIKNAATLTTDHS